MPDFPLDPKRASRGAHLARDAKPAGNLGGGIRFGKQPASLFTTRFHHNMISRLRHAEAILTVH